MNLTCSGNGKSFQYVYPGEIVLSFLLFLLKWYVNAKLKSRLNIKTKPQKKNTYIFTLRSSESLGSGKIYQLLGLDTEILQLPPMTSHGGWRSCATASPVE